MVEEFEMHDLSVFGLALWYMLIYYPPTFLVFKSHVISQYQGLMLPAFSSMEKSPGNEVEYSIKESKWFVEFFMGDKLTLNDR